jgi:hypothetical protein
MLRTGSLRIWRDVDHRRALLGPFLDGHRSIRDDVLAERVLELPGVAPVSRVAVLQPEDARGDVRRHVLAVRHPRHLAVLVAKDLERATACAAGSTYARSRLVRLRDDGPALRQ